VIEPHYRSKMSVTVRPSVASVDFGRLIGEKLDQISADERVSLVERDRRDPT
jgi:hypothetical protein